MAHDPIPGHGSDDLANDLFVSLIGAANATLPEIDLYDELYEIPWDLDSFIYKPVENLTAAMITEQKVGGNGVFDVLMSGFEVHLAKEFEANRITGAEYAKTYVALTTAAMQNAVAFLLGKDQSFWAAAKAQADAITARVNNETARINAMMGRAQFALTKLKLATEDSTFGQSEYEITNILPAQKTMLVEQGEAQRAQTLDTRADGTSRSDGLFGLQGMLGQQKALYGQQILSYKADVKVKGAKMFMDSWIAQKTLDDTLIPPTSIGDTNLNTAFTEVLDSITSA